MGKALKAAAICFCIAAFFWCAGLLRDRALLNDSLIRLHVVANSDTQEDQQVKLQVRDAILSSLQKDLRSLTDMESAKIYLSENLPKIQRIANDTLEKAGFTETAAVTLCKEAFDIRHYDTFTLPSGIYESLRVVIGAGEGKNWWCVAFPTLCLPATSQGFQDTAAGAGFPETLTNSLQEGENCEFRFFLLDALGNLERKLFNA